MLQLLFYYSLSLTAISSLSSFLSLFCVSLFFVTFLSVLCTPKPPKYCCCIYYSLFIIIQYYFFIIFLSYYHNYSYLSSFFLSFFHYFLPERPYYCCYSYYLSFIITNYYFIIIIIITIPLFFLTISDYLFTFCIPKRLSYFAVVTIYYSSSFTTTSSLSSSLIIPYYQSYSHSSQFSLPFPPVLFTCIWGKGPGGGRGRGSGRHRRNTCWSTHSHAGHTAAPRWRGGGRTAGSFGRHTLRT